MKKHISILFLIIATTLLLTHSFVPHHHHRAKICLEQDHCESIESNHLMQDHSCHHETNETETCLIRKVDAVPANRVEQQNYAGILFICGFNVENHISVPELIASTRLVLYLPNTYSYIASHSFGRRAPPVV